MSGDLDGCFPAGSSPTEAMPPPALPVALLTLLTAALAGLAAHLARWDAGDVAPTSQVVLLAGALLVGCWLVETVKAPARLDRAGQARWITGVDALLLPAAVLLPPLLLLVVAFGSVVAFVPGSGPLRTWLNGCSRAIRMSAAMVCFTLLSPVGPQTVGSPLWLTPSVIAALIAAGTTLLVVESVTLAWLGRAVEGLPDEDAPVLDGHSLLRDSPEVAIGALSCVLMSVPVGLVLLVPLFLLRIQMLRAHAAHLAGYRDVKTGLLSHAAFHDLADRELSRARRAGHEVGALMMDLDGLKAVNTAHGHLAGDRYIATMGDLLRRTCRREDVVGRFGGDEFVVLLPGAGMEQAMAVANRIRATARDTSVPEMGRHVRLAVSIGVTVASPDDTVDGMLDRADRALRHAKQSGRNQVEAMAPARL